MCAVCLSNVRRRSVETGGRAATRLVSLVCANVSAARMELLEDFIRRAQRFPCCGGRLRGGPGGLSGVALFLYLSPSLLAGTPFCWRLSGLLHCRPIARTYSAPSAPFIHSSWRTAPRATGRPWPAELWRSSRRGPIPRVLAADPMEAHASAAAAPPSPSFTSAMTAWLRTLAPTPSDPPASRPCCSSLKFYGVPIEVSVPAASRHGRAALQLTRESMWCFSAQACTFALARAPHIRALASSASCAVSGARPT